VVLLANAASADESLLDHQTRIASDAAKHGHCDVVASIGAQVSASDPDYHQSTFVLEPAIAACIAGVAPVPPAPHEPAVLDSMPMERPPVSGERIFVQGFFGTVGGFGGFIAGGAVGLGLGYAADACEGELGCYPHLVLGGLVGGTLGIATGVYLAGTHGNQTGSANATYGGAIIGIVVGGGLAIANIDGSGVFLFPVAALPLAGAIIGFNATRRYKRVQVAPVASGNTIGIAGTF